MLVIWWTLILPFSNVYFPKFDKKFTTCVTPTVYWSISALWLKKIDPILIDLQIIKVYNMLKNIKNTKFIEICHQIQFK